MKITINLPDDLVAESKAVAIRRRTTLEALVEHGLRGEISSSRNFEQNAATFSIDEHGLPLLEKSADSPAVTSEAVYRLMEELSI